MVITLFPSPTPKDGGKNEKILSFYKNNLVLARVNEGNVLIFKLISAILTLFWGILYLYLHFFLSFLLFLL